MQFKQKENTKKITTLTIAITLSALIALAPTLSNQNAFAKTYTMKIVNDLEQDLIFSRNKK